MRKALRNPTPEEVQELWDLYWTTDITGREIVEAYNDIVETVQQIPKLVGPLLWPTGCSECGGELYAWSRSDRETMARSPRFRCHACLRAQWDATAAEAKGRAQRLHELKTMPYREYLQTPEWAETRNAALHRARYRCQTCNGDGRLHVHHRTYVRRGEEYNRDLIVLCEPCHQLFHDNAKLIRDG